MAGMRKKPVTDDGKDSPSAYEPLHPQRPGPVHPSDSPPPAVTAASESRLPLELLFQLSFDGVVLHEPVSERSSGNFLRVNDAICRLLGYTPEEMRDLTPLDILAPEELDAVPSDTKIMQRKGLVVYEKALITKDGRRLRAEISSRLFELDGRQMAVSTIRDVTQRRQMEEQLRRLNDQLGEEVKARTEELRDTIDRLEDEVVRRVLAEGKLRKHSQMFEGFFQYTITPLAFLDRYLNFVRVNEAYAREHGTTPESFVSRDYFTMHPGEESRDIFEQVIETGQPYFAHARPFVRPGHHGPGVTYWDWQLTPVLNDVGDVQFLVLNMEDVTQRQVAFQELERRARQLQNLALELSQTEYRERSRLAEVLHDDLQQILAAAKFHVSMLSTGPRSHKEVHEISEQVNRMLREAIDKSRSLSHELSPAVLHQTDLDDTFEWLAHQMESKHGLTVHLEVRGCVESPSQTLRAFLYKAARELLFNVTKHAHTNEAKLRLQRLRGRLCLTISDAGRGFDPRAVTKTTGFGLFAIRERVELLGGRMKMRSAPGRGSTFLLCVPDAESSPTGALTAS